MAFGIRIAHRPIRPGNFKCVPLLPHRGDDIAVMTLVVWWRTLRAIRRHLYQGCRPLCRYQGGPFSIDLLAGGREPLLERLHFDLERGDLRLRRVALDREAAEDVAFSAELGKLAGVPVVELLNGRLGSPRRHREFRSQEIPADLSVRERRR